MAHEKIVIYDSVATLVFSAEATCSAVARRIWPGCACDTPMEFFAERCVTGVWKVTCHYPAIGPTSESGNLELQIFDRNVLLQTGAQQYEVQSVQAGGLTAAAPRVVSPAELQGLAGNGILPIYPQENISGVIQVRHHSWGAPRIRVIAGEAPQGEESGKCCFYSWQLTHNNRVFKVVLTYNSSADIRMSPYDPKSELAGEQSDVRIWEGEFADFAGYVRQQELAELELGLVKDVLDHRGQQFVLQAV